nr:cis-aconitate decarboxylase [Quercus suber]
MKPTPNDSTLSPEDSQAVTKILSSWIHSTPLSSIPPEVVTRAKYLILDGIACALVGARLPWSETAVRAFLKFEPAGACTIIGWGRGNSNGDTTKLSPLAAALLNSTFIQGFELDDFHSGAPLHSNSLLLPSLFSAVESLSALPSSSSSSSSPSSSEIPRKFSGEELLRSYILAAEVGPRVGLALHGTDLLTRGWHSGAIQGSPVAAAAVASLLGHSPAQIESALGIACTQAGGLMSAQFGSMAKRMQHGFAARNGVLAALLASEGYTGIEDVFETKYGGYLSCFGQGANFEPQCMPEKIVEGLGERWETGENIRVKLHAAMAALHAPIQALEQLQKDHPEKFTGNDGGPDEVVGKVVVRLGKAAHEHGGWRAPPDKPLSSTAAQMSVQYALAAQMLDGEVMMAQYGAAKLNRPEIRALMLKVDPIHDDSLDVTDKAKGKNPFRCIVEVYFKDGTKLEKDLALPKGISPPASNEDVVAKWRSLVTGILDDARRQAIERMVLHLEDLENVQDLINLLADDVKCPIDIPLQSKI